VNDAAVDLEAGTGRSVAERSSKRGFFDIFLSELARLKRIVAGMGLGVSDAEDILQDVSIKVLKQAPKYETAEEATRWLIKVTVNRCIMEHRRRQRFRRRAGEILKRRTEAKTNVAKPDDEAIAGEELEIVRETLQELDESLLTAMVLRYFSNLNSGEIGEILGLTASTIRSRLCQGRMILAKRLIERGVEP
jgi:RNA polymerase sigma-70 factor (ECF subfamily)